jgi:FtsZ-binding cell division protein ZapB
MTEWDLELSVETKKTTICQLYRDNETVYKWEFDDIFNEGDWDWNVIYKTTLEDIIKLKLYKRPKLTKKQLKQKEEAKKLEEKTKQEKQKPVVLQLSIEDLKKKRSNLSAKISNYRKQGKDVTSLEHEMDEIRKLIKNTKK